MEFDFDHQFHKEATLQPIHNDQNDGYYQEYCRLFLANIALTNQVKDLIQEKNMLRFRLGKYEDEECFSSYERNQKAKRFRRNAHQIQRFYKCSVKSCSKSYGSQGSLNQHYKLKHPQIYATLPNVQPFGANTNQNFSQNSINNIQSNSNSKINNILKELGSYKSIKFQQVYCRDQIGLLPQERQNISCGKHMKENYQGNSNINMAKFQNVKKQVILKKQVSIQTTFAQDSQVKLKRSSRQIKKRDIKDF